MILSIMIELAIVLALAWNWFGGRTSPDRFASAYGIVMDEPGRQSVRNVLHRTYLGRVFGGLGGLALLGLTALLLGVGPAIAAAFVGLIAGTMVGIALAQVRRHSVPGSVRHASLNARTVRDYAPARAGRPVALVTVTGIVVSVLVVATAPAGLGPFTPVVFVAVATVLIAPFGVWLQRRIVEAARDDIDPSVDDALRTAAVRAVHHSILGVLLCGLVVAGVAGLLTSSNLTVHVDDHILFTAPPGSTSISPETSARSADNPETGPLRVSWIEADGSHHQTRWARVTGSVSFGSSNFQGLSSLFGLTVFLGGLAVFVEWGRATSAWKRRPAKPLPVTRVPSVSAGSTA